MFLSNVSLRSVTAWFLLHYRFVISHVIPASCFFRCFLLVLPGTSICLLLQLFYLPYNASSNQLVKETYGDRFIYGTGFSQLGTKIVGINGGKLFSLTLCEIWGLRGNLDASDHNNVRIIAVIRPPLLGKVTENLIS